MAESVRVAVRVRPFNQREKDFKSSLIIDMKGMARRDNDAVFRGYFLHQFFYARIFAFLHQKFTFLHQAFYFFYAKNFSFFNQKFYFFLHLTFYFFTPFYFSTPKYLHFLHEKLYFLNNV